MPWGAVAGAVVGAVANSALKDDSAGGGGGGSSVSKEPWANAAPWLNDNINQGRALQAQYMANPFSQTQQRAYGQQFANSDYMRSLMNAVNSQAGANRPFNRGSPGMVPQRYSLPSSQPSMQNMGMGPSYGTVGQIFGSQQPAPQQAPQAQALSDIELARLKQLLSAQSGQPEDDGGGG